MYSADDILCGGLASVVVPCGDFVSDVSIESGAILLDAPVGIWSLLCLMIMPVRCLVAVLMLGKLSMFRYVISVSMLFVNANQTALL